MLAERIGMACQYAHTARSAKRQEGPQLVGGRARYAEERGAAGHYPEAVPEESGDDAEDAAAAAHAHAEKLSAKDGRDHSHSRRPA